MFEQPDAVLRACRDGFGHQRVAVIGDLMLDRYFWGNVDRVSPEAPIPVLHIQKETDSTGGAANVARNLRRLGCQVALFGFRGDDVYGRRLAELIEQEGIETSGVLATSSAPTIAKMRAIAGRQQVVRLDYEAPWRYSNDDHKTLLKAICSYIERERPDALILSDYGKGVTDYSFCSDMIAAANNADVPVFVDPKGTDFAKYHGATTITPNHGELSAATSVPKDDLQALLAGGRGLLYELNLKKLVFTRGEHGLALIDKDSLQEVPAMAREVYDVSGAGDAVIATLGAAVSCGLTWIDAARLANLAGSVVVEKVGTQPIEGGELLHRALDAAGIFHTGKACTLDDLLLRRQAWQARGERVVFTNGCFDVLHAGHVRLLEEARQAGDRLIIGLNSDDSVRRLKGESRPVNSQDDRAEVLASMAAIDAIVVFDEDTPLDLINAAKPDVLVKGADYQEEEIIGASEVKGWGGEVKRVELLAGRSTSSILKKGAAS